MAEDGSVEEVVEMESGTNKSPNMSAENLTFGSSAFGLSADEVVPIDFVHSSD